MRGRLVLVVGEGAREIEEREREGGREEEEEVERQ